MLSRYMPKSRDIGIAAADVAERAWLFVGVTGELIARVAGRPIDRLRWLIEDFCRRRIYSDARRGELAGDETPESLARELMLFCIYQAGPGSIAFTGSPQPPKLPAKIMRQLSVTIAEGIDRFITGESWEVQIPGRAKRIIQIRNDPFARSKDARRAVSAMQLSAQDLVLTFTLAAQDLVQSELKYIARCAGCNLTFVREDLRALYCTPQCGWNKRKRDSRAAQAKTKTARKGHRRTKRK